MVNFKTNTEILMAYLHALSYGYSYQLDYAIGSRPSHTFINSFFLSTFLKALHAAFLLSRAARNWLATQAT
jgi:predicted neutral ceramidase superfamily lipid hydrolase